MTSPRRAAALVATVCATYMLSQFYRSANAVIGPDLMADLALTAGDLGVLTGVFFLVFAACQIPAGLLLDRYGPRLTVAGSMLFGVAGAVIFAVAGSLAGLAAGRALLGIGSSCLLIGPLVLFSRWFAAERFATMSGLLISLGSLGNLLATAPLAWAAATIGWRGAFLAMGALTAALIAVTLLVVRDAPPGHAHLGRRPESLGESLRGLGEVLRNPRLPYIFAMNFSSYAAVITVLGLWGGPYLYDVHGMDTAARGNVLLLMAAAGIAGYLCFGPLDRVFGTRKGIVMAGAGIMAAVLVALTALPGLAVWQVAALFALMSFAGGSMVMIIAHGRGIFPERLVGRGLTTMNIGTMGGAAFLQTLTGYIIEALSPAGGPAPVVAYQAVFACIAVVLGLALLIYSRVEDVPP